MLSIISQGLIMGLCRHADFILKGLKCLQQQTISHYGENKEVLGSGSTAFMGSNLPSMISLSTRFLKNIGLFKIQALWYLK